MQGYGCAPQGHLPSGPAVRPAPLLDCGAVRRRWRLPGAVCGHDAPQRAAGESAPLHLERRGLGDDQPQQRCSWRRRPVLADASTSHALERSFDAFAAVSTAQPTYASSLPTPAHNRASLTRPSSAVA